MIVRSLPTGSIRNFQADMPNTRWTSDITYIPTDEGWLWDLAVVMDLFSRRIVGWSGLCNLICVRNWPPEKR